MNKSPDDGSTLIGRNRGFSHRHNYINYTACFARHMMMMIKIKRGEREEDTERENGRARGKGRVSEMARSNTLFNEKLPNVLRLKFSKTEMGAHCFNGSLQ